MTKQYIINFYNIIGDYMKKFITTILFTTILSLLLGNTIFNIYKKNAIEALEVMNNTETVYMLLYGSYNSIDKVNKLKIDNYLLEEDSGYYRVYVGITKNIEIANKIEEIYNELRNNIYIREKMINNISFIDYLNSMERDIINKSNDEILGIEKDIINKYKELK